MGNWLSGVFFWNKTAVGGAKYIAETGFLGIFFRKVVVTLCKYKSYTFLHKFSEILLLFMTFSLTRI